MHELVTVTYDLTVTRPDGSIRTERSGRAESFVKQFLEHLKAALDDTTVSGTTEVGGTNVGLNPPTASGGEFLDLASGPANSLRGVVIGSGTTAVSVTDFDLDSQLTTNINHAPTDVQQVTTADPNASMSIQRDFTNNTSGSVTVEEIGAICSSQDNTGSPQGYLILRDRVTSTPAAVNETVSVEYTISIEA